jgi:hypothetical protein
MVPERRHLFIFSFKAILFCVLLAGIIALISGYVPVNHSEKIDTSLEHLIRTKDTARYDIFFFSNSYIYSSIDPLYLEHLTGLKSLLFCSDSEGILFTIETIRQVLKYYRPQCIVIDLSRASTMLPEDRKSWSMNVESLLSSDVSLRNLLRIIKICPKEERMNIFFEGYSGYTAALNNLSRWKEYKKQPKSFQKDRYLGFVPLRKQSEEIKAISLKDFTKIYYDTTKNKSALFDEPSRDEFYKFFRDFAGSGIKVIFISSLKLNSRMEYGFDDVADSLINLFPKIFFKVNLNNGEVKKYLLLAREDFFDPRQLYPDS